MKKEKTPQWETETRKNWEKENRKMYGFRCNKITEPKLAEFMEKHKPYNTYLKSLVLREMEKEQE